MSEQSKQNAKGATVEKDVETLIKRLRQEAPSHIRWIAAWALGETKDARAVGPLIEALKDEAGSVRGYAALALGEIGDKNALKPLVQVLRDGDGVVRGYAARALGRLKDAETVDCLIQAMEDEYWFVRENAATALGEISDERALERLKVTSKGDSDWQVREAAVGATRKIERRRREKE